MTASAGGSVGRGVTFDRAIGAFTAELRERYGFGVGHATTHEALRAVAYAGVADRDRLRRTLRAVYCASRAEVSRFDDAFDGFFLGTHGIAQPPLQSQQTRPGMPRTAGAEEQTPRGPRPPADEHDAGEGRTTPARREAIAPDAPIAELWQALRARYSAAAARSAPPRVPAERLDATFAAVDRLLASVRIAPSRRRRPDARGDRIDLRRTLRASVGTAGDPLELRRTARSMRSPRFVVLIDGSRSTSEHAGPMLAFAFALVQRSRRARAFAFSTDLREITAALRDPLAAGRTLDDLGEAWGGGTRIGDNVLAFVERFGGRALGPDTVVLLFSDGLDVGNLDLLARAMRELRTRSAAIVWLHPHAAAPAFAPSAGGLRVARPYYAALYAAGDAADFASLAERIGRGRLSARRT